MTDDNSKVWLKPEQIESMRTACHNSSFQSYLQLRNDAIIALAYDTGLRPSELVATTVEMFDQDDAVLRLPSSVQKQYPNENTPPPATIGLADDEFTDDTVRTLSTYLKSRWKDSMYLFPSRKSEYMTTRAVENVVKKAAVEADVTPYIGHQGRGDPDDVHPHALRHSVAYRLLSARDDDTTMYDVRNRLRHRSILTTERHYDFFDRR